MRNKLFTLILGLSIVAGATAAGRSESATIRVAAQDVNETVILAHMAGILIEEHTDFAVTVNTNFTGSSVLHQAMTGNEIDLYPTWTGTQLTGVLRYEGPNLSGEETYRRVKEGFEAEFGFTWSDPLGFNNTYVMVVRRETAERYNLQVSSDLSDVAPEWLLAGDDNFDIRSDAYPGWSEHYGITFRDVLPMQYGLIYRAVDAGEVEVAAAYSTDSRIATMDLVMLDDDLEFFPDYSGAYVIGKRLIEQHPEVITVVNRLGGQISTEEMSALNARFDAGEEPDVIARDWLRANAFIN